MPKNVKNAVHVHVPQVAKYIPLYRILAQIYLQVVDFAALARLRACLRVSYALPLYSARARASRIHARRYSSIARRTPRAAQEIGGRVGAYVRAKGLTRWTIKRRRRQRLRWWRLDVLRASPAEVPLVLM